MPPKFPGSLSRRLLPLVFGSFLAGCALGPSARFPGPMPDDPNALLMGAEILLQDKQYPQAAKAYTRAAQHSKDESLAEQATRSAYETHQPAGVLASAERWLELNPTNEEARRFAGFAALQLYRIDQATEHFAYLLQSSYISPSAGYLALLPQLLEEGTPTAATAVLTRLAIKDDGIAEAHYALGQAALDSQNYPLALIHAKRARELSPLWSPGGSLLARAQMATGDVDGAIATAHAVMVQDGQPAARLEYGVLLLAADREQEGRTELQALATAQGSSPAAERALALTEYQSGESVAAAKRFTTLAANGVYVDESLYYLGMIAERRGSWEEALQFYQKVTAGEQAIPAQSRAARLKTDHGSLQDGLRLLEEFAIGRPQYTLEVIAAQSALLSSEGDDVNALARLDTSLRLYPDAQELQFARAYQLEKMNRVREAIAQMNALCDARPGDPVALNALGYTLVDRTRERSKGYDLIQQALEQTPDNGAVLDSMGWALHTLGRDDEALQTLQKSREHIQDPDVEAHLIEVQVSLKRVDDARETVAQAVERYPDDARLKKLQEHLKRR